MHTTDKPKADRHAKYSAQENRKIFATAYRLKSNFYKTRKSIAFKLQNPRLREIDLHIQTLEKPENTIRDILHIQLLGHRDLRKTLI
jgi:hypothetical protein